MVSLLEFKFILSLIDKAVAPLYLSPTQEIVLKETWNGKTYSQIAYEHNYESEYIKSVGCNLWQLLSTAFEEQVNKSNFVPFMRQKISNSVQREELELPASQSHAVGSVGNIQPSKNIYWTTAPNTDSFIGREAELETLESWVQETQCRCIIVTGMVGCGKTTLSTKLAKEIKHQFDCVIWFSLSQTPNLITLIQNYLTIIAKTFNYKISSQSTDISFLLTEFIDYLKKHKILLVLDDLQNILSNNRVNVTYKKQFEDYGQLLRAIITTSHRSLLITNSNIQPTMLKYYSQNQVKSFCLNGFSLQTTKDFLTTGEDILLNEQEISSLSVSLQSNPQLLKIVFNQISDLSIENREQFLHDLSLLEGVANLLERELGNLSDFEREIIYWISISCFHVSLEQLRQNIELSHPRIKFLRSIKYLCRRSLLIERDDGYSLMPVMKTYLRRKLIKQSIRIGDLQIQSNSYVY